MKTTIIGMLLSPFLLMGQQTNAAWTNIGPSPAAVQAIAVDPRGTGTIFMGTLGGGVRKSVDGGITIPGSSCAVRARSLHTRFHRQRTSGRR